MRTDKHNAPKLTSLLLANVDAIQVHVLNFQTRDVGEEIIATLDYMGFGEPEDRIDDEDDSNGGIISTRIVSVNDIHPTTLEQIRKAVCEHEGVYMEYKTFRVHSAG